MMRIIHRLTTATVTAKVREEMNVEDEYFSAIERRDTELMAQKRIIAEKDEQIAEKDEQIAEKEQRIQSIARLMMDNGMSVVSIMQATGLTQEQIDELNS